MSFAVAGVAALLAGCSAAIDSPYPAVHDMPAPRQDLPMNADELKRVTDGLTADRNKLNAEAQADAQAIATGSTSATAAPEQPPAPAAELAAPVKPSGARTRP